MIITIQPSDLIKRCLWNEYKVFCLVNKTEDEINEIIQEDKPFIMSEEDAYVVGLLKVVETDNLIHRFKVYIEDLLKVRSNLFDNKLYINRNIVLNDVKNFKNRFPESFKPGFEYRVAIDDLIEFVDIAYKRIDELEVYTKVLNDKNYVFVTSNDVKDIMKDMLK